MEEAGNAVMDAPDTAALTDATVETPEGASEQAATDPEIAPETTDSAEPYVSPFEGRDPAEIEKDPVVAKVLEAKARSVEARLTESFRQQQENAVRKAQEDAQVQRYSQERQQAAQAMSGNHFREAMSVAKALEEGTWTEQQAATRMWELSQAATRYGQIEGAAVLGSKVFEQIGQQYPDFRPSAELARQGQLAVASNDPVQQALYAIEYTRQAVIAGEAPKIIEGHTRTQKEREAAEGRLATERDAEKIRSDGSRRPTDGLGAGRGTRTMSLDEIEAEPVNRWLARPKEERDLLLRRAHEAAGSRR